MHPVAMNAGCVTAIHHKLCVQVNYTVYSTIPYSTTQGLHLGTRDHAGACHFLSLNALQLLQLIFSQIIAAVIVDLLSWGNMAVSNLRITIEIFV